MIHLRITNLKTLSKKTCMFCVFIVTANIQYQYVNSNIVWESLSNLHPQIYHKDTSEKIVFKKPNKSEPSLKDNIKTILFWTPLKYDPLYYLKEKGQNGFVKSQCKINNCYATDDRNLFGANISRFDAIVFNGQALKQNESWYDLPESRSEHQKYIFFETESAGQCPLCLSKFDNFFNWTMTYRLDSDIPCPFIVIKNKTGHTVGPKEGMVWQKSNRKHFSRLDKKKAIAWFPFDCTRRSEAIIFSSLLKEELGTYKLDVDVYGDCGPLLCIRGNRECDYIERDYFFVLALENSMATDYVTDKVLVALQNNVVPIVNGGANYTNFLPPGSYLDGTILNPSEIAAKVVSVMENYILSTNNLEKSYNIYQAYLEWKVFYSYHKADQVDNVCALCAAVNDEETIKQRKVYKYLRKWWNPDYRDACADDDDDDEIDEYD